MMKSWMAVKAKSRVAVVTKGWEEGRFFCISLKKPSCSASLPTTDVTARTRPSSPFLAKTWLTSWRVPRTTSVKVPARAMADWKSVTGTGMVLVVGFKM